VHPYLVEVIVAVGNEARSYAVAAWLHIARFVIQGLTGDNILRDCRVRYMHPYYSCGIRERSVARRTQLNSLFLAIRQRICRSPICGQ